MYKHVFCLAASLSCTTLLSQQSHMVTGLSQDSESIHLSLSCNLVHMESNPMFPPTQREYNIIHNGVTAEVTQTGCQSWHSQTSWLLAVSTDIEVITSFLSQPDTKVQFLKRQCNHDKAHYKSPKPQSCIKCW